MLSIIDKLPFSFVSEIYLVNTKAHRNNRVNKVKVYDAYDYNKFVVVTQNELDNLLSQCKLREEYKPVFLV